MRLLNYSGVAARYITGLTIISLAAYPVVFPALPQGTTPVAEADTGDETTYYFLTDHLGSVDAVLDEQGNVVERRDYLPYGSERVKETFNGVPITDLGFTGKHLDKETELNYYGARYYDPVTGRFLTIDPMLLVLDKMSQAQRNAFLSNPQNLNMYSYVRNNPVRYTDPTGMYGEDVHYHLTFFLSLAAGLSYNQSRIVADNDQWVDDNPDTEPGWNLGNYVTGTTEEYHFSVRQAAVMGIGQAISDQSLSGFGIALHTYQDTYSHADISPEEHALINLFTNDSPDYTYSDPEKALKMAMHSFFFIRQFNKGYNGMGDLTEEEYDLQTTDLWNQSSSSVKDYLESEDKSDTDIFEIGKDSKSNVELKNK
ncbi:hypothetical protein KJ951_03505 [Patescibacteria group bacterium]|nr:hypothetical protein [Patescibacteria group bacterium]MBU1703444.1 hypothetical protein [Patescibacteria group bacterium]